MDTSNIVLARDNAMQMVREAVAAATNAHCSPFTAPEVRVDYERAERRNPRLLNKLTIMMKSDVEILECIKAMVKGDLAVDAFEKAFKGTLEEYPKKPAIYELESEANKGANIGLAFTCIMSSVLADAEAAGPDSPAMAWFKTHTESWTDAPAA